MIPAEIREDDRRALRRHFSTANEEWIVLAVAMMGWLNKTMDGRGVPLEKLSAGLVYAGAVCNGRLSDQLRAAGATPAAESPVQALARALSPSPAAVDEGVVASCRHLAPAAIVELVTFIALLQLLHRLESDYPV